MNIVQTIIGKPYWAGLILGIFGMMLYANTLGHDYTQDDAIVIYDNMYTQKGISGIYGLLTKDTFHGFFKTEGKSKLVTGGRYRPLTPIMFAVEKSFFGQKPIYGHLFSVLWYGILLFIMFAAIKALIIPMFDSIQGGWIAFIATALFAAHPIHTEVVANIKGRDEIMALLACMASLYMTLKPVGSKSWINKLLIAITFFLGSMSKENTVTFLAVIPIGLIIFKGYSIKQAFWATVPALVGFLVFLMIRTSVLGFDLGGTPMELMNNPFLKIQNSSYVAFTASEKLGTIAIIMLKYLGLLFIPITLTHDYYPYQIDITKISDPIAMLTFLLYVALGVFAILRIKKYPIASFSILLYLSTISIVSNLFFPIGTNMSERFLFMPSVGFSVLIAGIMVKYIKNITMLLTVSAIIIGLYGFKTIDRNKVWKDDFTLFTTDVHTSTNSAKVLNAAGGALTHAASTEKNEVKKSKMLTEAIQHLTKAATIHPNYFNAYLIKGNAHFHLGQWEEAIKSYENCMRINPSSEDAIKNLAISLRDAGRNAGEKENNLQKATAYLTRAEQLNPTDIETLRLLGISNGMAQNHKAAISYFQKVVSLDPTNAYGFVNLSNAYKFSGNEVEAQKALENALSIDPNVLKQQ